MDGASITPGIARHQGTKWIVQIGFSWCWRLNLTHHTYRANILPLPCNSSPFLFPQLIHDRILIRLQRIALDLLCSQGWPWTHSIAQAGFEDIPCPWQVLNSLCSQGKPWTHFMAQSGFELTLYSATPWTHFVAQTGLELWSSHLTSLPSS